MPDATPAVNWHAMQAALQAMASDYGILIEHRADERPQVQWYVTDAEVEAYGATLADAMAVYARLRGKAVQG